MPRPRRRHPDLRRDPMRLHVQRPREVRGDMYLRMLPGSRLPGRGRPCRPVRHVHEHVQIRLRPGGQTVRRCVHSRRYVLLVERLPRHLPHLLGSWRKLCRRPKRRRLGQLRGHVRRRRSLQEQERPNLPDDRRRLHCRSDVRLRRVLLRSAVHGRVHGVRHLGIAGHVHGGRHREPARSAVGLPRRRHPVRRLVRGPHRRTVLVSDGDVRRLDMLRNELGRAECVQRRYVRGPAASELRRRIHLFGERVQDELCVQQ